MDTGQLAWQIDVELRAHGTAERAEKEKAYLKSELDHYGATMPAIVSVVKSFKPRYLELDHDELLALVRALWSVPVHEARMAASRSSSRTSGVLSLMTFLTSRGSFASHVPGP